MESFFSLLQKNVLDRRAWATLEELRIAIVTWIERPTTGAADKPHSAGLPPTELETAMTTSVLQAA